MIAAYVEAGLSKFVVRAVGGEAPPLAEFVAGFRAELIPLQN